MAPSEVIARSSLRDELRAGAEALRKAGVSNAETLAVGTWAALARETPGAVWMHREAPPEPGIASEYREAIARQAAGEPFQYAVGRAGFRFLDLVVDRRVLIPRSETEGLVDHVLQFAQTGAGGDGRGRAGVVADIGTGSGAIALSLATEGQFSRVIATDVSGDALDVARTNTGHLAPDTPVEFRQGSFLEPLKREVVDVIVSNPPYVSTPEWELLEPHVHDFEPRLALDGGPDGLDAVRVLLRDARSHLRLGGLLALEIDSTRGVATLEVARAHGWRDARVLPDATGRDRYVLTTREQA